MENWGDGQNAQYLGSRRTSQLFAGNIGMLCWKCATAYKVEVLSI